MTIFSSTKPIVVMLGVHRSGTSLAASIYQEIGLRLGDRLIPGHRDNPKGFWEHSGIVAETREFENELGINPFRGRELFPPTNKWWKNDDLKTRYDRLKNLIEAETSKEGIFGFKDPRTLLLLPMWQALFAELNLEPRYVLLLRHPGAVAASMRKRNGLRLKHGEFVWRNHISYGLAQLKQAPTAVVHYERWSSHTKTQIAALAAVIDQSPDGLAELVGKVQKKVDPDLTTFKSPRINFGRDKDTLALYESLSQNELGSRWPAFVSQCKDVINDTLRFAGIYEGIANRADKLERRLNAQERETARLQEKVTRLVYESDNGLSPRSRVEAVEPRPNAPYDAEFPDLTQFIGKVNQPGRKLRVCIAAEDIVGPVRNGGIGTTYTHLSKMLASAEHEVVIVYLRGNHCQNKTMRHWVDWYKSFGVTFVPIDPDKTRLETAAPQWIRPMYALYEFLKQERFDLVHVSEWRGSAYLSLLAKKQGLAFDSTVFCVKASSPWLWNREYGYHTLDRLDDLPKIHAEKRSIELADLVIGGSRYLLCWMLDHGYKLPQDRCYVQPNVVFPLDLDSLAKKRRQLAGTRIPIDEIVFFGRLEYRKGLDIFFKALERLVDRQVNLPKITVMGKYGERIPTHPDLSIPEYIKMRSRRLAIKVQVLSNFGNEEALKYLLSGKRLAVMPSRIENSTLAVYEAGYYGIPCVASDMGGTSELIDPEHHDKVLAPPNPIDLSAKLSECLSKGGFIPKPSFRNDRNLGTWLKFHGAMGAYVNELPKIEKPSGETERAKISICVSANDDHEYIQELLSRLSGKIDGNHTEVVLIDGGGRREETVAWIDELKKNAPEGITIADIEGYDEQQAWNQAAKLATGDLLVFPEKGALLKPEAADVLGCAAAASDAGVFGCFYDRVRRIDDIDNGKFKRHAVLTGDHSSTFFGLGASSPLTAIKKEIFLAMDGFSDDFEVPGAADEFTSAAMLNGYAVEVIPEPIAWVVDSLTDGRRLNTKAVAFRSIRPFIDLGPHCFKKIFMAAKGLGSDGIAVAATDGAAGPTGGGGTIRDPMLAIEEKARRAAHAAGSSPGMRNLAWTIYHLNITVFRMFLFFQIKVFNQIVKIKNKILRR